MRINLGSVTVDDEAIKLYARHLGQKRATRDDVRRGILVSGTAGFDTIIDHVRRDVERELGGEK